MSITWAFSWICDVHLILVEWHHYISAAKEVLLTNESASQFWLTCAFFWAIQVIQSWRDGWRTFSCVENGFTSRSMMYCRELFWYYVQVERDLFFWYFKIFNVEPYILVFTSSAFCFTCLHHFFFTSRLVQPVPKCANADCWWLFMLYAQSVEISFKMVMVVEHDDYIK